MCESEPWVAIADDVARTCARRFHLERDDATQAARVAAWKAWHKWKPGGRSRESYVRRWALYGVIDMLRNLGGYGSEVGRVAYANGDRHDPVPLPDNLNVAAPSLDAAAIEAACDVAKALSMIPAREAVIVSLVDLDGLTQREVGETLGVSRGRVGNIRTRALKRMRPLLAA